MEIFVLLVVFQLKHFICDFPLQGEYMLGKFKDKGWAIPLAAHCGVQAIGTFIIVSFFSFPLAITLALLDFILHFIVDRIKADKKLLGRYQPAQPQFWWALGADQMTHHLINYGFIYLIVA